MDYTKRPKYHYKPQKGWINDPNGLVYFKGYYHIFYQHQPNREDPHGQAHWGHARTKDFLEWEEMPTALYPDMPYDQNSCWSGTSIIKDGVLYIFYTAVPEMNLAYPEYISIAYSTDGILFEKYRNNPIITEYPADGGPDFRDPAVTYINGKYYCVIASGNRELKKARLLLYESNDLFHWNYIRVMTEWDDGKCAECPSFLPMNDGVLLTTSVCNLDGSFFFSSMYGRFANNSFTPEICGTIDRGPDQYAGQIFRDHKGRYILISWIPGLYYDHMTVGCLSIPKEITVKNGKIYSYPVEEVRHLLTDSDPAFERTADGFVVARTDREPLVYRGEITELKLLRDEYVLEIFINGGEENYTVLL